MFHHSLGMGSNRLLAEKSVEFLEEATTSKALHYIWRNRRNQIVVRGRFHAGKHSTQRRATSRHPVIMGAVPDKRGNRRSGFQWASLHIPLPKTTSNNKPEASESHGCKKTQRTPRRAQPSGTSMPSPRISVAARRTTPASTAIEAIERSRIANSFMEIGV
jgi:hypothetical protein